jgi:hypothetical protein
VPGEEITTTRENALLLALRVDLNKIRRRPITHGVLAIEADSQDCERYRVETPLLAWLCAQPFASTEMERRRALIAARASQRPMVPARLCQVKIDHLNATIWRAGEVPGTTIGS